MTDRWLAEVTRLGGASVERRLMSLSAVNEGKELDDWYRAYNDGAWIPARVAAALLAGEHGDRWDDFYVAFGTRRHVGGMRDDRENLRLTLAELGLPPELALAAEDQSLDDDLRARTTAAVAPLGTEGGTPIVHLEGTAFFGPVLDGIPRGDEALQLLEAVRTMATTTHFAELKRGRSEDLKTA